MNRNIVLMDLEAAVAKAEEQGFVLTEIVELMEMVYLRHALALAKGNVSRAADLLEMHRNCFTRGMRKYGLCKEEFLQKGSRKRPGSYQRRGPGEEDLEPTLENIALNGG